MVAVLLVVVAVADLVDSGNVVQSSHVRCPSSFSHSPIVKAHLPLYFLQDTQVVSSGKKQMSGKFLGRRRSASRIHSVAVSSSCFFLACCCASNCCWARFCWSVSHASARQFKSCSMDWFSFSSSCLFISRIKLRFRTAIADRRQP